MASLKCKMCGGDLEVTTETNIVECEYCQTKQTIPNMDDEKKIKLFERANRLRYNCEFDKAASVYESIVAEYAAEAEGYWGLILCKYGIEYVDDPVTGKKVPTCHRSSFDSIMDDEDFELVMENSDPISRVVYRDEAKYIEGLRKGIIEVSGKEEPYDIFICYKETDEEGNRTLDSVIAQDVYDALTIKGYKVFFSRISLEDKLGLEYEPYIFAALNSAKVMLAFGTCYDYYNAVWVKNEWSRYLKLMAVDKNKHLIPCYKNVDAYDIPKEFVRLQAQDMGKIGAIQDLVHGIDKLIAPKVIIEKEVVKVNDLSNTIVLNRDAMAKRGFIALEDREWERANDFFEQSLNTNAENGWAYWGELLASYKASDMEELINNEINSINLRKSCNLVKANVPDNKNFYLEKYDILKTFTDEQIEEILFGVFKYKSAISYFENVIDENKNQFIFLNNKLYQRALKYSDAELKEELSTFERKISEQLNQLLEQTKKEEKIKDDNLVEKSKSYYEELEYDLTNIDNIPMLISAEFEREYNEWENEKAQYLILLNEWENEYEKYQVEFNKWKNMNAVRISNWDSSKTEYATKKREFEEEINRLTIELRGAKPSKYSEINAKIINLKNKVLELIVPEKSEFGITTAPICPKKPILRKEPSIEETESNFKTEEIINNFKKKWLKDEEYSE